MMKITWSTIAALVLFLVGLQSCATGKNVFQKGNELIKVGTPDEIITAIKNAKPGDKIVVKGGYYKFNRRIDIQTDGTADAVITLMADPTDGKKPKFDFSALGEGDSNQGIILRNSFWLIKGIDVFKAGDNGILITSGHDNIIEFCSFSECSDTGLQLSGGANNNLILNCDSYFNADSKIENADGFACKIDVGSGNKFKGCRAWQNLDDGWDGYLKNTDNVSTIYENCWAFANGILKNGSPSGGDGNGFKSGGSDDKLLKHNATYLNCVSIGNMKNGFDHNSNRGEIKLMNCISYANKQNNLSFGSKNQVSKLTITNTTVIGKVGTLNADEILIEGNSWQSGAPNSNNFNSPGINELSKPRKSDGSLPDVNFNHAKQ